VAARIDSFRNSHLRPRAAEDRFTRSGYPALDFRCRMSKADGSRIRNSVHRGNRRARAHNRQTSARSRINSERCARCTPRSDPNRIAEIVDLWLSVRDAGLSTARWSIGRSTTSTGWRDQARPLAILRSAVSHGPRKMRCGDYQASRQRWHRRSVPTSMR